MGGYERERILMTLYNKGYDDLMDDATDPYKGKFKSKQVLHYTIKPEIVYPCPLCGACFSHKRFVIKHLREEHNSNYKGIKVKFNKPK